MIDEKTAIEIATEFLKAKGIETDGFAESRFIPTENAWTCCFRRKTPIGAVDSPAMEIVDVNCVTGQPELFDVL
jgi:hypothetical protein